MTDPNWQPAPAPGASRPQPLPPAAEAARLADEAARREAEKVGREYGRLKADLEENIKTTFETPFMGGITLWDRMTDDERRKRMTNIQNELARLPKLPTATSLSMVAAVRTGFSEGADAAYETRKFEFRAVFVACELAKLAILNKASTPSLTAVGAASTSRFSDCAAQTAARITQEMTGVETSAEFLVRAFGLPRTSISGYDAAVAYALNWFEGVGIKLSPKPAYFNPQVPPGKFVIFLKGGGSGGHVVYGEVSAGGIKVIDHQIGTVWSSLEAAQAKLGMQATAAYRVEAVVIPQ